MVSSGYFRSNLLEKNRVNRKSGIRIAFYVLMVFLPLTISCQTLRLVHTLEDRIRETSGLVYLDGRLITHNDSGNKAYLYEIDTATGKVISRTKIKGADNVDWEDICKDEKYIYIGDFGNNGGDRQDLTIYRIEIKEFLKHMDGKVSSDKIRFKYREQLDYTYRKHHHNFDAETLISYRDSLYIFSKNWANHKSYIYRLPKHPGTYTLTRIDSIEANGLVTGGVYDDQRRAILLTGYLSYRPFAIELPIVEGQPFSFIPLKRYPLAAPVSLQTEGIALLGNGRYYISGEEDWQGHPASLYTFSPPVITSVEHPITNQVGVLYPNPTHDRIRVRAQDPVLLSLYDKSGSLLIKTNDLGIDLAKYPPGIYFLHVLNKQTMKDTTLSFVKE